MITRFLALFLPNKMDKVGADFFMCLKSLHEKLGANAVPIQYPIGREGDFKGMVDLIKMKALIWDGEELGAKFEEVEIPADIVDECKKYRENMIEKLADFDDTLANKYLEGTEISNDEIIATMRKAVISGKFFPFLCGTSFKNKGVQPLLDFGERVSPESR